MKPLPVLKKNQQIEVLIHALGSEGQGIGRFLGMAVFVPGALPNETVRAHIIKVNGDYCVGKLLEVIEMSPRRTAAACGAYERCGGCTLMHLDYAAQLDAKRKQTEGALTRIGKIEAPRIFDTLGMEEPWRYRNKGSFPFASVDGRVEFGFFAPRSHRLVPLHDCPIQNEKVVEAALAVREWARECGIVTYDEEGHTGMLRHCVARVADTGDVMVVVVTNGALTHGDRLIELLRGRCHGIKSIIHNRNDERTNVIFGRQFVTLWGESTIVSHCVDLAFEVGAESFLQVNPTQAEALYRVALEYLKPMETETIFDLYCGIGTITLPLAKLCKRAIGIESVPEAVQNARRNAHMNSVENVDFECGIVEEALPALLKRGISADAAVLDPPRKGCERAVLEAIAGSGMGRVVYVSCNPATLARDVALLCEMGYSLEMVQPVDMFPQTAHVECVALLTRGG